MKKMNQTYKGRLKAFTIAVVAVIASSLSAIAQNNQQITGRVSDASTTQPLAGANILVEGSSNGTATDSNGVFKLNNIQGKSILLISFAGYATERVPVKGSKNLSVSLTADKAQLNEVVVVGYGNQQKNLNS